MGNYAEAKAARVAKGGPRHHLGVSVLPHSRQTPGGATCACACAPSTRISASTFGAAPTNGK